MSTTRVRSRPDLTLDVQLLGTDGPGRDGVHLRPRPDLCIEPQLCEVSP